MRINLIYLVLKNIFNRGLFISIQKNSTLVFSNYEVPTF
ncbi:hypothetical protein BCAH1134_C0052 (plasmid) [Bacillus cereus AH1134]|nr:hypothetical protein BCAH1134_C0052 [Bacillus cereus AH1134]